MQVGGITRGLANSIKMMDESIGKKAIADANKVNARYITYWDNEFPDRLKRVFGSPIGIYIIGKLKNKSQYTKNQTHLGNRGVTEQTLCIGLLQTQ